MTRNAVPRQSEIFRSQSGVSSLIGKSADCGLDRGSAAAACSPAALPAALDYWWDSALRSLVASALAAKTNLKTADKPDTDQTPRR